MRLRTCWAHQSALASNVQSAGWSIDADGDAAAAGDLSDSGGPVLALQWTKDDLEALGLVRLDISPSAAMATVGIDAEPDEATQLQRGDCSRLATHSPSTKWRAPVSACC